MVEVTEAELARIEAELRNLLKGEFSSLTLSFNDGPAPNYMTVAEWDDTDMPHADWVSEEERQKARATNSQWVLHWYPNTPVGFNDIAASSLPALFEGLRAMAKEEV